MNRKVFIVLAVIAALAVALIVLLLGCSQEVDVGEIVNVFSGRDCQSPVLVSVSTASSSVVKIEFNEPVKVYGSSFSPFTARADGKFIYVTLNSSLPPGQSSEVGGRVKDYSGNTTGFSVEVWGHNAMIPPIVINEFTTKGTDRSPDRTELLVKGNGNINGMVLHCGIPDDSDARIVFGDVSVKENDLIVVWWTEKLPDDVLNEGLGVKNLCANTTSGPSSNNGTLVLCDTPSLGAGIIDAVVYSNFSASHEGFGTRGAKERAQWVIDAGFWEGDAIDSTTSTATRSMSRVLGSSDTNRCKDWYVTVTGGSTFGLPNVSEAY